MRRDLMTWVMEDCETAANNKRGVGGGLQTGWLVRRDEICGLCLQRAIWAHPIFQSPQSRPKPKARRTCACMTMSSQERYIAWYRGGIVGGVPRLRDEVRGCATSRRWEASAEGFVWGQGCNIDMMVISQTKP